ncbi:hypothetical protein EVAR_82814_1, partial [Eumeta japonica]
MNSGIGNKIEAKSKPKMRLGLELKARPTSELETRLGSERKVRLSLGSKA